jgi:hypothetical protein
MDPTVTGTAAASLVKEWGAPGAIIVLLAIVCAGLWRAFSASISARIDDMKENTKKYDDLVEKVIDAQRDTETVLHVLKDRMEKRRS